MNSTYEKAHIAFGSLVTQLVRRVFSELYAVRMETIQTMGKNDWKSMYTGRMWSISRTSDKMAEFDDVNFEDHPAIVLEYIKFLACNLGFDMLETLEKDVSNIKADAKDFGFRLKEAVRKSDAAITVSNINKKAIVDLTKHVDRKADK